MAGENAVSHVRLIDFDEVTPGQFFRAYAGKSTDTKPGDDDGVIQRTGNIFIAGTADMTGASCRLRLIPRAVNGEQRCASPCALTPGRSGRQWRGFPFPSL